MAKKANRPAWGEREVRSRDNEYLQGIRDGRVNRAQTFKDRRKESARNACRSKNWQ